VTLILLVAITFQLKYRSWPLQAPHQLTWCDMGWQRGGRVSDPPHRLYPVGRRPPVIGTRFLSPYSPRERRRLGTGDMAEPCGGALFARIGDHVVAYDVDPTVAH
jgi:hypothetical protein